MLRKMRHGIATIAIVRRRDPGDGSSPNAGAVAKMENLKVAKAGWIFVKVRYYDGNNSGDYSFALGPGDIDSPPKPPPR
jgi:hypothetical protein